MCFSTQSSFHHACQERFTTPTALWIQSMPIGVDHNMYGHVPAYLRYFLPYLLHTRVGIWTHFAQERTIWAGFVLLFYFSPRASPRDNSFVPTAVQNSPSQQEKWHQERIVYCHIQEISNWATFNESNFNKYQPRYLNWQKHGYKITEFNNTFSWD